MPITSNLESAGGDKSLVDQLIENFNSRLNDELIIQTDKIIGHVVNIVDDKLKENFDHLKLAHSSPVNIDNNTPHPNKHTTTNASPFSPQDVRYDDTIRDDQTNAAASHTNVITTPINAPSTSNRWNYRHTDNKNEFTSNEQHQQDQLVETHHTQQNRAEEDPNFVITRNDQIDSFLQDSDSPQYKGSGDNELKRKQDAARAISTAFKNSQFGGTMEEDWERHIADFETLAMDYQLRSKDFAYFLRLTLKDQALAVHRSEFPKNVKTYPKICTILTHRFDNALRRETNTKSLLRLDFKKFLKDVDGSNLKAINNLVLRIEQLSAITTTDQRTERAKIRNLMNAIERTHWYITATAGVEQINHFTEVVQRINHHLAKMTTNNPRFDDESTRPDMEKFRIKRDILLAVGIYDDEEDFSNDGSDDNDAVKTTESEGEDNPHDIQFGGQRRYGTNPGYQRRRNYNCHNHRGGKSGRARYSRGRRDGHNHKAFNQRCFNCGCPECQLSICPETKNQERIESNLNAWRKQRNIDRPRRDINLASVDPSTFTITEALSAEIFLEHANKAITQSANFFEEAKKPKVTFPCNHAIDGGDADLVFMTTVT